MTLAEIRAYIKCLDNDCPDTFGTIMVDREKIITLLKRLATLEAAARDKRRLLDAIDEGFADDDVNLAVRSIEEVYTRCNELEAAVGRVIQTTLEPKQEGNREVQIENIRCVLEMALADHRLRQEAP